MKTEQEIRDIALKGVDEIVGLDSAQVHTNLRAGSSLPEIFVHAIDRTGDPNNVEMIQEWRDTGEALIEILKAEGAGEYEIEFLSAQHVSLASKEEFRDVQQTQSSFNRTV